MKLQGTTILITGGARGIGRALTEQLVARGAHVVVAGRDPQTLEAVASVYPGAVSTWPIDLADPAQVRAMVTTLPERHPDLSIVINNAGVQALVDFTAAAAIKQAPAWRQEIAVNFDAAVALSTGLLPHLAQKPSAAIVNVTSGLALAPKKTAPIYCATKAALRSFTKALRYQCQDAKLSVRVVDVIMALVETDMTQGRGGRKMTPTAAANQVVQGLVADRNEIWIGIAKVLPILLRLWPGLVERMLRNG